jgi:hypothetical protein
MISSNQILAPINMTRKYRGDRTNARIPKPTPWENPLTIPTRAITLTKTTAKKYRNLTIFVVMNSENEKSKIDPKIPCDVSIVLPPLFSISNDAACTTVVTPARSEYGSQTLLAWCCSSKHDAHNSKAAYAPVMFFSLSLIQEKGLLGGVAFLKVFLSGRILYPAERNLWPLSHSK